MSTGVSPVIHTAEVATNKPSNMDNDTLGARERGNISSKVPISTITANNAAINSAGLVLRLINPTMPVDASITE